MDWAARATRLAVVSPRRDGECVHHTLERHPLGSLYALHDASRALLAHALQAHELVLGQGIDVRYAAHQPGGVKQLGRLLAYAVYVHHAASAEMLYTARDLRTAAVAVRAYPGRLPLHTHQGGTAVPAMAYELHGLGAGHPRTFVHPHYLGYDLPPLLHIQVVPLMDVELADYVLVVERGPLHYRAAQQYRLQVGHRGHDPHAPRLEGDEAQRRAGPAPG